MKSFNRIVTTVLIAVAALSLPLQGVSRNFNDKLLNRPYSDLRKWHLGFSVGLHMQDVKFTHNGFVGEQGRTWFMEQPAYSPGFCVNGLVDLRLSTFFSLRFTPGIYFGNRDIRMIDTTGGEQASQNIKSAYVVLPVDLKFSALRYRNSRPYMLGGIMPAFDVAKKPGDDYLKFKPFDMFLTAGFGCDFYLPYFKFVPEVKFCFGLVDILERKRPGLEDEPAKLDVTKSLAKATSKMIVLTFYFE